MHWMLLGGLAFLFAIINLVRALLGKTHGWAVLMFLSLSSGALALVAEYQMISRWALAGDWSAIQDVTPFMGSALLWLTVAGIILNMVTVLWNLQKKG